MTPERTAPEVRDPSPVGLTVGLVLGLPFLVIGVRGVLVDASFTHPAELARWVVGAAVVHDALLVPLVLLVGTGLRRLVRDDRWWRPLRWALFTVAVTTLVAWPFVRGYGKAPTVPSLLARNYAHGLLVLLAIVVALAAAWAAMGPARGVDHSDKGLRPQRDRGGPR